MTPAEIEEVILALKVAGAYCPEYEILPDGSYHFFTNGQKIQNPPIHIPESRRTVS